MIRTNLHGGIANVYEPLDPVADAGLLDRVKS
jgi:hypothetical protein